VVFLAARRSTRRQQRVVFGCELGESGCDGLFAVRENAAVDGF
jgi:hypothetical protein